jgi:hypothetical protein
MTGLLLLFAVCVTMENVTTDTSAETARAGASFYVSPTGNDKSAGTLAAPFATLERAQQAMEKSSIKTTYVEGGTYSLRKGITLTGADSGETWQYYAPNGVDTAVLDGGGTISYGFYVHGASNVTINGLKLENFTQYSLWAETGTSGTVIENNDVGSMTVAPRPENALSAGVGILSGGTNVLIENNYVHDVASCGISVSAWAAGSSVDGTVVKGNVVIRTSQRSTDDGAIYLNESHTGDRAGRSPV